MQTTKNIVFSSETESPDKIISTYAEKLFSGEASNWRIIPELMVQWEHIFELREISLDPLSFLCTSNGESFLESLRAKPKKDIIASYGFEDSISSDGDYPLEKINEAFSECPDQPVRTDGIPPAKLLEEYKKEILKTTDLMRTYLAQIAKEEDTLQKLRASILQKNNLDRKQIVNLSKNSERANKILVRQIFEEEIKKVKMHSPSYPQSSLVKRTGKYQTEIEKRGKQKAQNNVLDAIGFNEPLDPMDEGNQKSLEQPIPSQKELQQIRQLISSYITLIEQQICRGIFNGHTPIKLPIYFEADSIKWNCHQNWFPKVHVKDTPKYYVHVDGAFQMDMLIGLREMIGENDFKSIFFCPDFITYQDDNDEASPIPGAAPVQKAFYAFYNKEQFNGYQNIHDYTISQFDSQASECIEIIKQFLLICSKLALFDICLNKIFDPPEVPELPEGKKESRSDASARIDSTWYKDCQIFIRKGGPGQKLAVKLWLLKPREVIHHLYNPRDSDFQQQNLERLVAFQLLCDKLLHTETNFFGIPELKPILGLLKTVYNGEVFEHMQDSGIAIPAEPPIFNPSSLLKLEVFMSGVKENHRVLGLDQNLPDTDKYKLSWQGTIDDFNRGSSSGRRATEDKPLYCFFRLVKKVSKHTGKTTKTKYVTIRYLA